jgi:hypothetical protein
MEYSSADKYRRMLRSYASLKRIGTDNGNSITNTDARDAAEDFFNQCHHFKDWLKKDSAVTFGQNPETFINSSPSLKLAADYCNSHKHAGLDRQSRSGKSIDRINTHMKMDITPRGFVASSWVEITIGGQSYDVLKLAAECVEEWDRYLRENRIVYPEP